MSKSKYYILESGYSFQSSKIFYLPDSYFIPGKNQVVENIGFGFNQLRVIHPFSDGGRNARRFQGTRFFGPFADSQEAKLFQAIKRVKYWEFMAYQYNGDSQNIFKTSLGMYNKTKDFIKNNKQKYPEYFL